MQIYRIKTYEDFLCHCSKMAQQSRNVMKDFLSKQNPDELDEFTIPGYSYTVKEKVDFLVDYKYSDGKNINYRERVVCPKAKLNNRARAVLHLYDIECEPYDNDNIYVMEQVTPIYAYFKKRFKNTVGSEFLGDDIKSGETINNIRHEDTTKLSFENNKFEKILSFDVFEHVPNYINGFQEVFRVLKKNGIFIFSVPFRKKSKTNLVRAKIENGQVKHLCKPEYHGDPVGQMGGGDFMLLSFWLGNVR